MPPYNKVGTSGFEPPISRPPDAHFNRTKLRPELVGKFKYQKCKNLTNCILFKLINLRFKNLLISFKFL